MYQVINGWTKERMKQQIRERNNGKPAFNGFACVYLTDDNNCCAAGCFIPNGHEGQQRQGLIGGLLRDHPDLKDLMPLDADGMMAMQVAHDEQIVETDTGSWAPKDIDMRVILCDWIDANCEDPQDAGGVK